MTEKWRLVNTDRAQELYDIQSDPSQRNNIAIKDLKSLRIYAQPINHSGNEYLRD